MESHPVLPADRGVRLAPQPRGGVLLHLHQPLRSLANAVRGTYGGKGELGDTEVNEIAHGLAGCDLVGFSSMTGYADLTPRVIERLREIDLRICILWGGHPIIHLETPYSLTSMP